MLDLIARDHPVETVVIRTMRQYMPACALTLRQLVTASELPPHLVSAAVATLERAGAITVLTNPAFDSVYWLQRLKSMDEVCAADARVGPWFRHATTLTAKRSVAQTIAAMRQPKPRKPRPPTGAARSRVHPPPAPNDSDESIDI